MTPKLKTKTKTYNIEVPTMRRWRLTPEDVTILKLSLMNWKSTHRELEKRRKSLLHRMSGDFFMILYSQHTSLRTEEVIENEDVNRPVGAQPITPEGEK